MSVPPTGGSALALPGWRSAKRSMWVDIHPVWGAEPTYEFVCRGLRWEVPGLVDVHSAWMRVCQPRWEDLRGE